MRILYFFPEKFASTEHGIYVRVVTILQYFKSKGFKVDMLSLENHRILNNFVVDNDLVNSIHFADEAKRKKKGLEFLFWKIQNQYYKIFPRNENPKIKRLPNYVSKSLILKIEELQKANNYNCFLLTYTYWADLVKYMRLNGFDGKAIIDPTDFLTLQQYYKTDPKPEFEYIGNYFGDELKQLSQFDEVIHISYDEYLLFSSFLPNLKHHYLPQFFNPKSINNTDAKAYDVLFFGSNNPYNIEGINWFLKEVSPLLDKSIKIAIVGKVCNNIITEGLSDNVSLLGFVEDADALYQQTKITICPLKRGTGMKIKVIESLSYGIPVVSTTKGVDGFLNKKPFGGVLIGNTATEFANEITKLVTDDTFLNIHQKLASELFYSDFSVEKNLEKLSQIF